MATGTGKTLTAAAVIKLFMRTGNAQRVLFLVDRLELETQAWKAFVRLLKNDFRTVIYKENRDDWRKAEIVVSTVQSLQFNNKYRRLFSPTDFDLLISDEAHRSIGGNSRAVFEYFIGYKLGLTATPKDYLKRIDPARISERDPRDWERRQLLDTYKTFGCESSEPTFRYSLIDGVARKATCSIRLSWTRGRKSPRNCSPKKAIPSCRRTKTGNWSSRPFSARTLRRSFSRTRPTVSSAKPS